MRLWRSAAGFIAIALAAWASPSSAASLISTSTTSSAFDSASRFHVHFASGYFWVAFHNGTTPVVFSSLDGVSWASQGPIFSFNPAIGGMWTTRFLGTNVIALGFNSGNSNRYYRNGTLNGNGTVSWSAESVAQAAATATPINALIANQKPMYWRASAPGQGQLARGSAFASPAWSAPPLAPTLAPTTGGRFWAGAVFPTGGSNPEDLILVRATTQAAYAAGSHRLVSVRYDQLSDSHDASWYNVSTLGGGLAESATTEVKEAADDVAQLRFAAVRDTSGNLHALYVNRNDDVVHYKKDTGFAGVWSRISTDVTLSGSVIDRVALAAAEANNVFVFYSKSDNGIYYRRFNGTIWGGESVLKVADANPLQGALAPMESANGCSLGLAWEEGAGSPFNVMFSLGIGSCGDLSVSAGAGTLTVTAPASFEMRFNTATGGGIDRFFDLALDPPRTYDLAGSGGSTEHEALMLDELVVGGTWYTNERVSASLQKVELLEATPTRVKVRSEDFYGDWPGGVVLPGLKLLSDYSVYPSGRTALRWNRVATSNVSYTIDDHELTVHYKDPADPLTNWAAYSQAAALPPQQTAGDPNFVLFQIEQAQAKTDFLHIRYQDWPGADKLETSQNGAPLEEYQLYWRDSTLTMINAGTSDVWNFLTYFKPTNFTSQADAAVTTRSTDYRTPDPVSAIGPGSGWNENTADADFFNESEAAYTLDLNPATGLTFNMDGSTTTRYSPFFKIRQWRSLTPPATITVAGATKVRGIDFKADVKPVSRAAFAKDLLWHSTLQVALAVNTWPDIGSPGVSSGVGYATARYGQGANVTADNQYISFPVTDGAGALTGDFDKAKGAVEFWYKPSWIHNDTFQHDLGGIYANASNQLVFQKLTTNALRFRITASGVNYDCTVTSGNYSWRVNDWVHLRFEWDEAPASGPEQRIVINQTVPTQTCAGNWTASNLLLGTNAAFRLGDIGDGAGTFGAGLYDELYSFGISSTTPTALANGGLAASTSEYLGTGARNFQLTFVTRDAAFRGPRLFIGSDSKFLGLNIALAVKGVSPDANLRIHYWNGMAWALLSDTDTPFWAPGFSDTTNSLRQDGTMSWPESLVPNWEPYSVNGGPDLYYIRIGQQYGTYTTLPTEAAIKTDILLFQYCADVSSPAQTFAFGVPLPTAVELSSFEARGLDGAAELTWRTASELKNLGFHLYRATSIDGPYERITASVIPGLGSSPSGASYQYTDSGLVNGVTYYFKLEDIDTTGKTKLHGPVSVTPAAGASPPEEPSPAALIYGDPATSSVRVLAQSRREIVLELTTGGFRAEPQADGSVRLSIPGFSEESQPGSPLLPVKRSWIPIEGARTVEVASVRAEDVVVFSSLRPMAADSPELVASVRGTVRAGGRSQREGRAFRGEGLYPEEAARILAIGYQADERKARIEISPLRWNRSTGELALARRLVVRLVLSGREPTERRKARAPAIRTVARRLATREPGLYGVTYEELFGAGRRRAGASSSVRLSRLGIAVPFHIEPDRERFGPGSTLYFVSEGASMNPYGDEAVYELESSAGGVRMPVVSAPPQGSAVAFYWQEVSREENRYYQAGLVDADDLWLWDVLLAPVTKSYPFEVSALAEAGGSSRLSVQVQGTSDFAVSPDHHVRVAVNGTPVFETTFEGKSALRFTAEIPPGVLREGGNELALENVGDTGAAYSMVMLDGFEVSYPRRLIAEAGELEGSFSKSGVAVVDGLEENAFVLDVSQPEARWLGTSNRFRVEAGRRYRVVSPRAVLPPELKSVARGRLTSPGNGADYLIVGPRALLEVATPLLELRQSQGLRSRGVAIEDVYSEFGFGEPRPEAVREFLSYAYHHWQTPAPRYVLLLGDGTYDFKDYLGTGVKNQVPPSMVRTSYLWTASDWAYAAIRGEDELADLAVGRLPAASADEARAMVAKILAYERSGAISQGPVVLVADNPDEAGDFEADAEELASGLLSSRNPRKVFLGRLGTAPTEAAIVEAFDEGASLLSYLGHGGIHLWASENVFDTSRVSSLAPASQQPFVLTLNCLNGYFHFPYFDSLAEALVKAEGKGAIAAFAPSGLSLNEPAHLFHEALLTELLSGKHRRMGDAVLAAQGAYADSGAFPELLRIYHLLGDPALSLR